MRDLALNLVNYSSSTSSSSVFGIGALFRIHSETVNPTYNCSASFRKSRALCLHRETRGANSDLVNKPGNWHIFVQRVVTERYCWSFVICTDSGHWVVLLVLRYLYRQRSLSSTAGPSFFVQTAVTERYCWSFVPHKLPFLFLWLKKP